MYDNVPGYRHEVDMWACGVIMYTLLCGAPPFWHRKQMQMLRMIMQGNYKFGSPEWDDVSQSPKDLVGIFFFRFDFIPLDTIKVKGDFPALLVEEYLRCGVPFGIILVTSWLST
jgi:serine/threonine protein kinase